MYLQNYHFQNSEQLPIEILNRYLWYDAQTLVFQIQRKKSIHLLNFIFLSVLWVTFLLVLEIAYTKNKWDMFL